SLSCATCALLGTGAQAAKPWDIDVGIMNYIEQERNTGIELLIDASRALSGGDRFRLGLQLDTLTGATPNGATASNVAQTFTQSSGAGSYSVEAGELPADDTHMDTRLAVEAGYSDQHSPDLIINYDGHVSMEFDYLSFGFSNGYQIDFDRHNTSLFLGYSGEYNRVHPVGNTPTPLALMTPEGTLQNRGVAARTRSSAEGSIGLTQVIDRQSLFQVRLTRSHFSGYLNDPYKLLSIIDDQNTSTLGSTVEYRFENRPDSRDMDTFYFAYKHDLSSAVFDLSLRYSEDDWDISASTIDIRYRHRLAAGAFIQPHIRLYKQTEADFFRHSLTVSEGLPEFASADTRLGAFDAVTLGISYGSPVIDGRQHRFVAEFYTQAGESHPRDAIGLQNQQDLFPGLKALIFKYFYKTQW
ncbi:MAG: DUF3570 domain-containing protein, partial [Gammaproteobacteria bacterium]|nr:DUF3570 domain-containing protein [Gammaproteobacteria bacterium]